MRTLLLASLIFFSLAPVTFAQIQSGGDCTNDPSGCVSGTTCTMQPDGYVSLCQLSSTGTLNSTQTGVTNITGTQTGVTNTGVTLTNPLKGATLNSFLDDILAFVIRIGTVVVILMLVYVGYLFVVARGNDSKITEARQALLWTIVGALILLGAQVISASIKATVSALGG